MTFRSSWSGRRRKGHAERQRGPPKSGGPGFPARIRGAGVPRGGPRSSRPCTGPDSGQKRSGNAGIRGRGRRRTREAEPRPPQARGPRKAGRVNKGFRGERNGPRARAGPHHRAAAASPWLRPRGTSSTATRSPTRAVCGSRPEVARGSLLRLASRAASARHLRPSPGNPGSEGTRREGRSRARPGAQEGLAKCTRKGFLAHVRSGLLSCDAQELLELSGRLLAAAGAFSQLSIATRRLGRPRSPRD